MDTLMPKLQREINQKNEEICRLQQELSYLLHQNELLRKKVEDDEKAELKVNRILLENFANAKEEIVFLREMVEAKGKEIDYLKIRSAALQQDHINTLALMDTLSKELPQETESSKFNIKLTEVMNTLQGKKQKMLDVESVTLLEPQGPNSQLLKELDERNEEIKSMKMELKEQVKGHPNASDLEKQIENLYQEVVEKDNRICEMSLRIKALETLIEKNQSQAAEQEKEIIQLQTETSDLVNQLTSLKHVAQEKEDLLQKQRKQEEELQQQMEHFGVLETEKELLASSVTALEHENVILSSKLKDFATILQNEMLNWNLGDDTPCLIQGNGMDTASFSDLMSRITAFLNSTWELQQKNRQLHTAMEELFKDKAKLKETLQQLKNTSIAMEHQLRERVESLEQELRSSGIRDLDEEKDLSSEEDKENVAPLAESTVDCGKEKASENSLQLGRGRVKSLQEKFLALTLASQSPMKENLSREPSFRKKLWDDNEGKRSSFVSNSQN